MIGYKTSVDYSADNLFTSDLFYRHLDQAVINEDRCTNFDIVFQILIGNRSFLGGSHNFFRGQDELLTGYQLYLTAFKITQTDLRSLGI